MFSMSKVFSSNGRLSLITKYCSLRDQSCLVTEIAKFWLCDYYGQTGYLYKPVSEICLLAIH